MKRRYLLGALLGVMGLLLGGGFFIPQPVAANEFKPIHPGTLTIGLEGTYAPFSYRNHGKLTGYEVEVAKAVAKEMHLKPKFVVTKWDSLLTGLDSQRYDVIFNNVGITKERQRRYIFAEPYLYSKTVLIQKKSGNMRHLKDIKGRKMAQSTSSNFGQLAKHNGAKIVPIPGMVEAMNLIKSGRADGELNDAGAFERWHKSNQKAKIKAVNLDKEVPPIPAAPLLNKRDKPLQHEMNRALKKLAKAGTLKKLSNKYFHMDLTKA
ncbi:transporter substrate-binding domain-containing protein [Weissella kandleri]|uniref:transporter substrate-binding domain-containing protein n=1 Tax=Weissella kandleri TaxID=1616 RepID=UPI00387E4E96